LKGQDSNEKFKLYGNLEELKAWRKESKTKLDKARVNLSKIDEDIIPQNAKNDEVLDVEVLEEVSLNEPMKFLEFQQKKLSTYIEQNTPLRLLEHKKEFSTRDILNFLEQSSLNGKEKAFLIRHLERDLDKIKAKIKEEEALKETQKEWLEAFGLKSLDEEAIVEIPVDLKERLGKEIKLNKKDLEKLIKNKREKYILQIKETFNEPEAVFIDENEDLIFAKSFNDKLFFVNVNRDYGEAFKALSLAPKKNNNLLNKLDKAKEILKLDSKLRDSTAQQAFTGVLSAPNKSNTEIIAQINDTLSEVVDNYEHFYQRYGERLDGSLYLDDFKALSKDEQREFSHILYTFRNYLNQHDKSFENATDSIKKAYELDILGQKEADDILKKAKPQRNITKYVENALRVIKSIKASKEYGGDYFEKLQELKDIENKFYKYIAGLEKTKNQIENIQFQIQKANLEKINELNEGVDESVKNLIDKSTSKGRDMQIIGAANFTPQIAKYIHENKKRIAIEKLDAKEAENLGFKFPNEARATIDYTAIQHTLKRHGGDSKLAKESGQEPINYDDIANYRNIAKNADETLQSEDKSGNKVVVSFKQINGHFVVVEQMQRKNNDLAFKTMFKEKGEYKNSPSYKETRAKTQTLSSGYEPSANSFVKPDESIPQKPQEIIEQAKEQGKSVTETKEYETLKEHIWIPLQKEIQQAEQELIEYEKRSGIVLDDDYKQNYVEDSKRNFYRYYKIPEEVKAIQKKYFNQAMPQEYEEFLGPIENLPEQTVANDFRELGSEAKILQYFKDFIHNKYVGKPMAKGTENARAAEILFLILKNDLGIPDEARDLTSAKGKAAFGKFKKSLKKGELTDKIAFYLYDQNTYKVRKSIERLLNITPLKEFGTNYAEFYRDGKGAVKKLIREAEAFKENGEKGEYKGQVAGAFYKEGL
ncbi:PBECR2 nuclease fold domain-containing protein, partial [Campylobacter felis]|nr:PBECR2 nuclease fold domain-containing protein [Campylobacter felis]